MHTVYIIDPSPTARAALATGFRPEFAVHEGAALSTTVVGDAPSVVVIAGAALPRDAPYEPPFSAVPFLVVGDYAPPPGRRRAAPVEVVSPSTSSAALVARARALVHHPNGGPAVALGDLGPLVGEPFLPRAVLDLGRRAARACRAGIPVLISGEPGTGKRTLARSLHAAATRGPLLRVTPLTASALAASVARLATAAPEEPLTMIADGIDRFSGEAQGALVECLSDGTLGPLGVPRPFWLIATATVDLTAVAADGRLDAALEALLGTVVLSLPPLRTRAGDIGPISTRVLDDLGRRLGATFGLAPDAAQGLARHPWPGNLAELIGVLRRAAILATDPTLTASALRLAPAGERGEVLPAPIVMAVGPGPAPAAGAAAHDVRGNVVPEVIAAPPAAREGGLSLDLLLAQLAHELKNPMVTIKTFAQHLPALLEDAELRQRFAALTDDAIARMDGLLENILEFARLAPPAPTAIELSRLVDRALEGVADHLAARRISVHRHGWCSPARVRADEHHLAYGLRNLFESLVSELPLERDLRLEFTTDGTLRVRFVGSAGVTAKLQSFLADGPAVASPSAFPLRMALARAVLVRNAGNVVVRADGTEGTVVELSLPVAPGDAEIT